MKNRYPRLSLLAISFFFSFSLSAQTFTGTLSLVDASGNSVSNYAAGSSLYVNVSDADRNVSATAADTVTVSVSSAKETTAETVVLTETGVNTGVFSASMSFDPTGAVAADGSLQVDAGDMITVNYTDPADDFGNSKLISATSFYGMTSITSGFIMSNTTWTKANSPYFLTGDVIIPDSVTLTIEPGAVIRFDGSDDLSSGEDQNRIEIRVSGKLKANGNATDTISFISNAQAPAAGDWYGIVSYDATTSEQPSSYSGNWDKVGAVDISYAKVSHYIRGVSAYDYATATVNGIPYGWSNPTSVDSISIHNSVFRAGGDAYYSNEYWAFRAFEFVNNTVYNAGLYSYGKSRYKKIENNDFKNDRSSTSPVQLYVRGDQRSSSYPHRMNVTVKNNLLEFGYINGEFESSVSTSVAQNAAHIEISGNTIHRNNQAQIQLYYYNYGLPLDSTVFTISNNNVRGRNINGSGIQINSNGNYGSRWTINDNTIRSTSQGIRMNSQASSEWHVEDNTIDSIYYTGIYKDRGNAMIVGNTVEYAGRYYWSNDHCGVYLNSSANYPATDTLKNNTIRYNGAWNYTSPPSNMTLGVGGVTINGNTQATLNANNIYENRGHDVINLVGKSVVAIQDARYNFWGDSATVEMNTGANPKNISVIHDEYDDALKGFVNYAGYVDTLDGTPSALNALGTLELLSATGAQAFNYPQGDTLRVRVSDGDRNVSATAADTVTVSVSSAKETTAETVVLTETGVNTGVFSASVLFDPTGAVAADGSLQVDGGDMITVNYTDPADDFNNVQTLTATSFYGMTEVTSGFIMSNTTWTKANSPYFLTGDVIIPDSVTLTIEPGVNVRFKAKSDDLSSGEDQNRIEIRVSGKLKANGNATDTISFISNAQAPAAGDWYGIVSYDATTSEQPSSYSGNWDKVGAVDISYAKVSHYIRGVSAYDYATATVNGIPYGWSNPTSVDSISIHNSVFRAGGDAYYSNEYWAFRAFEFVNNTVYNAGLYSYGKSRYKKIENNDFKNDRSSTSPVQLYVRGDQRSSSYPHRMNVTVKNNLLEFGYINGEFESSVSTSVAQNAAHIEISGNTIHRNNQAQIQLYYYNYGLPLDSTVFTISNNNVRGRNINGSGIQINSNGNYGSRWTINDNTIRSTSQGIRMNSQASSEWHVEDNTIDSIYYTGIYKDRGNAMIVGNTVEYAGRYYWSNDHCGVYLNSSANYPATDTLKNNTIRYNGAWNYTSPPSNMTLGVGGVTINGNTQATLNANNIYENRGHDVINLVGKSVVAIQDARYNFWGDSATVEMNTGANPKNISVIHDEYDDALKGFVNYAGYVDTLDGTPSALNALGTLELLSATGAQAFNYPQGDTLRVRVSDGDRNVSATAADTVTVSVSSAKETTAETVVLTETGVNTGVFSASVLFDPTGAVAADGSLQVDGGDMITVNYTDPADDFNNVQTLTATSFYGMTEVTSGFIMSNTTWTKANSPYFLTGDVIIPDSVTLTIEPGVNVRFKAKSDDLSSGEDQNRIEIRVSGKLKANGNATDTISFISNAQAPAAGDWYGIVSYDATTSEQPSSYSGNWDKVGAVDISYAKVSHYIRGVSAYDYATATVNGIPYGWSNPTSVDSISIHNSVFRAGGDAYYSNEYWAFRAFEFVNNTVYNAGLYSYGKSRYKKIENNDFKNDRSSTSPVQLYVRGDQRSSSYPHRMNVTVKNNLLEFGYINGEFESSVSTSVAQNAAHIEISGNTIHRNNQAQIQLYYYNYGLPLDSTVFTISNNNVRGRNINGSGIQINSNGNYGSRWTINDNTIRSTSQGIRMNSQASSEWHVEDNTIDSIYYTGIYKDRGNAMIVGNTVEYAGRYYWSNDHCGVYLNSSANYPATDTLKNNTIRYNGAWNYTSPPSNMTLGVGGVTINGNTQATLNANNIYENRGHDVINLVGKSVVAIQDAKYNYWGPTTTAEIANGANPKNITAIHDEYDDALKGFVNYGQSYSGIITKDLLPDSLFYGGDSILIETSNGTIGDWSNGVTNANKIELNGYEGQIKVTFDFFGDTIQDSSYVMNLDTLYVSKIQADSLVGPIPGGNGSTGNMFNIINTSGQPLEITGFSQGPASGNSSASNVTIQVYSTPGDYTTQPSSSWSQVGTAVTNLTASATTGYCSISPVTIPAGATYGFYVGRTSGSVQYTNGVGTAGVTTWFSNSVLTVTEGLGGGYPNPTNNPRCWNGTVHYGDPNGVKINARPEAMFSQIQEAINASDTSDVILVGPGEFAPFKIDEGINGFSGLTIQGLDSLRRPVISGYDSVRSAEVLGTGILLKHLSFRNGYASTTYNSSRGGLLYAWGNSGDRITVESCDFKSGYAPQGGDYYAGGGGLTFINCEFLKNDSLKNTMIHVDNGLWANFYNTLFDVDGYANVLSTGFTHRIYNSTIVNLSGKLYRQPPTGHEFDFVNNIVVEKAGASISLDPDTSGWDGQIHISNSRLPVIPAAQTYSATAFISATSCDTLPVYFVDSANGDYRLSLLDDHHNIGNLGESYYRDLYGVNRPDVNGKVDLGAYESDASLCDFKQARTSIVKSISANNGLNNVTLTYPGSYTSFVWSSGDTVQSILPYSNLSSSYWVTATDADGCILKDTIDIETAQITFRVDLRNQSIDSTKGVHIAGSWNNWQPNVASMTDPDGDLIYERIETLIIGDTVEFKFINGNSWTDAHDMMSSACASVNGNRIYTVAGNDTLIAFHLSSCSEASPIDPLVDIQTPKCSGATIDLIAGNNVSNVVWSTGDTTNTITVSSPGTYWFTAIYPAGVVVIDSTVVPADYPSADTSVLSNGSLMFCSYQDVVLTAAADHSYLWSTGDTTRSITVGQSGSYYAVVTSPNGCVDTTATYVTTLYPDADTTVTASGPLDFCRNGSVSLTAASGQTYIWNNGATTQSVSISQPGTYQALVTTNAGCVDTTAIYTVSVFADPDTSVAVSGALSFCNGSSVTLTAASGQSYLWSTGDTTQSITSTQAGSYSALVTTTNGCIDTTATYTTSVFADPDTSVTASGPLSFCNGGSVTLTAAAGQTYAWSNGATTQSITVSQAGSYSATVTSSDGCTGTTATYTTSVFLGADTSVTASGPLSFCSGGSVTLTAAAGQTYAWSNGATTQSITVSQAGTYSATVTSSDGCTGTTSTYATSVYLGADTSVTTSGSLSFCDGGSVTLTAAPGQSYLWNTGDTTQSITRSHSTSLYAIVTSQNGCVDTTSTYVTNVYLGADTSVTASGPLSFCEGGAVTFTAASGQSYLWSTGDTTQSITAITSGSYSASITTSNGCLGTTTPKFVNVYAEADTSVSVTQNIICASDSAIITADANQSYLWNTGETSQSIVVNTSGNYFVDITTADGCTGVSDSVNITVVPDIVMPQIVSNGLGWVTSGATNSFTIVADSNYSYQWGVSQGAFILNGQGTDSINVFWGPADSNITIWLIASNGVCSDSTGITITISGIGIDTDEMGSLQLYPNPNGGRFAIKVDEEYIGSAYRVIDLIGRSINEGKITSSLQSFDLTDKPKGTYRIQIINTRGVKTLSVVIQ